MNFDTFIDPMINLGRRWKEASRPQLPSYDPITKPLLVLQQRFNPQE